VAPPSPNAPDPSESNDSTGSIAPDELNRRVLYAMLEPVAALALTLGIPAKSVDELTQMALFHQTRQRGLTLSEAADVLDVSMRTVSRLSKLLKSNFLDTEVDHTLPRRIEFMLWAEPLSEARIFQVLTDVGDPDEVSQALATLMDEGRVERRIARTVTYAIASGRRRLVRDTWLARVDALGNLAGNLANTVFARFFGRGEAGASFARTLTLRLRRRDLPKVAEMYEQVIWRTLAELDEAAAGDDDTVAIDFSVIWAPYALLSETPLSPTVDEEDET